MDLGLQVKELARLVHVCRVLRSFSEGWTNQIYLLM